MKKLILIFVLVLLSCLVLLSGISGAGVVDFNGETITYVSYKNLFEDSQYLLERKMLAEEKFNVKIELERISWTEVTEVFLNRLLSGESIRDIFLIGSAQFWRLFPNGAIYPIGTILPTEYWEELSELELQTIDEYFSFQDVRFSLGSSESMVENMHFMLWNKDLFDREGLPDVYSLYVNNEWTWEKMTEIVRQATRDTTGDGEIDQWGVTSDYHPLWFGLSNGASVTENVDGRIMFSFDKEPAINALNQYAEWSQYMGEPATFHEGNTALHWGRPFQISGVNNRMEDDFGVVPIPMGPNVDRYHYPMWDATDFYVLPINTNEPESLAIVHQFIFQNYPDPQDTEEWLTTIVRDKNSYEVIMRAANDWCGSAFTHNGILQWGLYTGYTAQVLRGEKSAAAAMAELKPEAQGILDDIFNQ